MVILLFYIGFFLLWIAEFKIKNIRQFKSYMLSKFIWIFKLKCWILDKFNLIQKSKYFKKRNRKIKEEYFPVLDFNIISEKSGKSVIESNTELNREENINVRKSIAQDNDELINRASIESNTKLNSEENINVRESIAQDNDELLNTASIDYEDYLTLKSTEPFIIPLIADLDQIQKKKYRDKKANQMSLTFINKEAKEVQALKNKEIGDLGEEYILEYEKRFLSDQNISYLPIHISKEFDGYGYDIISFDKYGNSKYIEVKTTIQSEKSEFYLSHNELETMHKLENYFIYRLCNFNDSQKRKLIIIDCKNEFKKHFILAPDTYKISKK